MNVHTLHMGITSCYIIQDKGTILIDCGPPNKLGNFMKSLRSASIDPKQIKLIINTHGHYDHIGSAKVIKDTTGAQIAMHEPDKEWLEKAINPIIPGVTVWGKLLSKIPIKPHIAETSVDIKLDDEDFSLTPFGIHGKVIYTPGHTIGSVSVLLETGDAFVGDLAMSGFPLRLNPGLPVFAEDIERVKENIKLLVQRGARTFYPGHGKPFLADMVMKFL
jgi:hydroxyacylglutathione hydrolase